MSGNTLSATVVRLFAATMLVVALAQTGSGQWDNPVIERMTADGSGFRTRPQSLVVDQFGFLHVIWQDGGRVLYATTRPHGVWQALEIASDTTRSCVSAALAVSRTTSEPIVAYVMDSSVVVATRSVRTWTHEIMESPSPMVFSPTIAVDDIGFPHVAWIIRETDTGEYHIAYRWIAWDSDTQVLEGSQLGSFGSGADPRIVVNPWGIAHIFYRGGDYMGYRIHHAWNQIANGTEWSYETLVTANLEDYSCSPVLAGDDELHVAVSGNDGWGMPWRTFYFSKLADEAWHPAELATSTFSASSPSLALDGNRSPHMVAEEVSGNVLTGRILYSRRTAGASWITVPAVGTDHFAPSFALDVQSYGHIICHTGGNTGVYAVYHVRSDMPLAQVPQIAIAPDSLWFGTVRIFADSTMNLTIFNSGTAQLRIDTLITSVGFRAEHSGPIVIEPDEEAVIPVTFAPTQEQYYWGVLEIDHNAPSRVTSVRIRGIGGSLSVDDPAALPEDHLVLTSYPNPFNATAMIRFTLPGAGEVKLVVFDALGRQTAVLVDEMRQAGSYSVAFDGSGLASGIYFARIETNVGSRTQKMMLLK